MIWVSLTKSILDLWDGNRLTIGFWSTRTDQLSDISQGHGLSVIHEPLGCEP